MALFATQLSYIWSSVPHISPGNMAQYVLTDINEFQLLRTWLWKSVLITILNNWIFKYKNKVGLIGLWRAGLN